MPYSWIFFAAIALVFWGITRVTQKLATNRISSELSFLWFAYAMIAISLVLAATVILHWQVRPLIFWLAVAGGTLNGLGALTSFKALESGGKSSIVISLISLFPLLTVAFGVLALHENSRSAKAWASSLPSRSVWIDPTDCLYAFLHHEEDVRVQTLARCERAVPPCRAHGAKIHRTIRAHP